MRLFASRSRMSLRYDHNYKDFYNVKEKKRRERFFKLIKISLTKKKLIKFSFDFFNKNGSTRLASNVFGLVDGCRYVN